MGQWERQRDRWRCEVGGAAKLNEKSNLIGKPEQHPKKSGEVVLTCRQLPTARVVCSIEGSGAVHYHEGIPMRRVK